MSKKVTMKDIAAKLDISINAVSLALNDKAGVSEDLRQKILQEAEESGYIKGRPKYEHTYRSNNICIAMNRRYFSNSDFYSQVLLGAQEEASSAIMNVLLYTFADDVSYKIPDYISERKVSGIICIGLVPEQLLTKLLSYNIPLVTVDSYPEQKLDSIMAANQEGSFEIVDYLFKNGYKKIGFFGDLNYSKPIRERYAGLIERYKLEYPDKSYSELLKEINEYSLLDDIEIHVINRDIAYTAARLKALPKLPEAFVCSNDEASEHLLKALNLDGWSVPQDIAITGFDDSSVAIRVTPNLTTSKVEMKALGREGFRRLRFRIEHPEAVPTRTSISTQLIIRDSTASK